MRPGFACGCGVRFFLYAFAGYVIDVFSETDDKEISGL